MANSVVKHTIRVNLDTNTVIIPAVNPKLAVVDLLTDGVWIDNKLWYPPSRIVSVEVVD